MIAVTQSRQLERFCSQVGGHSKKQPIECESRADAKAHYAKCGLPPNWSSQVVHRVRRVNLPAFPEFPVHVSENRCCSRVTAMRSNTHQRAPGGRKVIFRGKNGGLECPQSARVAKKERTTAIAQQLFELRRRPRGIFKPHTDERRAGPNDRPAD